MRKVKCKHCKTVFECKFIKESECPNCYCTEVEKVVNINFIIQPIDLYDRRIDIYEISEKINEIIDWINYDNI